MNSESILLIKEKPFSKSAANKFYSQYFNKESVCKCQIRSIVEIAVERIS
jgi:hypothetical protein